MLKRFALLLGLALASPSLAAEPQPVDGVVLGTFHLSNPGQDLNNARVDDVLMPAKQAQPQELAERLATFKPTKIVVERQAQGPAFIAAYERFSPDAMTMDRHEETQIGYRLAAMLGHKAVYGFDEQPGPGEPDYFPSTRYRLTPRPTARANGCRTCSVWHVPISSVSRRNSRSAASASS